MLLKMWSKEIITIKLSLYAYLEVEKKWKTKLCEIRISNIENFLIAFWEILSLYVFVIVRWQFYFSAYAFLEFLKQKEAKLRKNLPETVKL